MRRLFLSICLLSIFTSSAWADQPSEEKLNSRLLGLWQSTEEALSSRNFPKLSAEVAKLVQLRQEQDTGGYELLANRLLDDVVKLRDSSSPEEAQFLCRQSLNLAPHAAPIVFRALTICGMAALEGLRAEDLFNTATSDLRIVSELFIQGTPALLFAATAGLLLASLLTILIHFSPLVRLTESLLPRRLQRFIGRPLLLILLVGPLPAGPFITLLVWNTVFALVRLPKTRLPFITGLLFVAWVICVPTREILRVEMARPERMLLLRAWIGDDSPDIGDALALSQNQRQGSGILAFFAGQALRRAGNFEAAASSFAAASDALRASWQPVVEQAETELVRGNLESASGLLSKAEARGATGAAFAYLASRIAFESLDMEAGRSWFQKARDADEALVTAWQERELGQDRKGAAMLINIRAPLLPFLEEIAPPNILSMSLLGSSITTALTGVESVYLLVMGLGLVTLAAGQRWRRRHHPSPPGQPLGWLLLQFIPGARSVRYGSGGFSLATTTLLVLISLPLLGFPVAVVEIWESAPGAMALYGSFIVLLALMATYTEWIETQPDEEHRGRR